MKIKNYVLVRTINILKSYEDKKLPQKITYAIMKNLQDLHKEYELYEKQLKKIFDAYSEHFIKDSAGNAVINNNGIPQIEDKYYEDFNNEISILLNSDVEIAPYSIEADCFDYNSDKYDILTAKEISSLTNILCNDN